MQRVGIPDHHVARPKLHGLCILGCEAYGLKFAMIRVAGEDTALRPGEDPRLAMAAWNEAQPAILLVLRIQGDGEL
ncbi:MAG: hypothetical protein HC869_24395 [Rhodospirillales bacterium]|nr:hypothetical protein [Rhodospirillales bacterium]